MTLIINIPDDEYNILKSTGAWNSGLVECVKNGTLLERSSAIEFLDFLYAVIPSNEMEKYIEMYSCTDDKNNWTT